MAAAQVYVLTTDETIKWDTNKMAQQAIAAAEQLFAANLATGGTAVRQTSDGAFTPVKSFDPSVEGDVVLIPRVAGG